MKVHLFTGNKFFHTAFFLLILLLHLAACTSPAPSPRVTNGIINLENWNFQEQGTVPLDGTWRIFRNRFINPGDYSTLENNFEIITVPSFWNSRKAGITQIKNRGYHTYYTRIILPPSSPPLALKLYSIYTAYNLYINGEKITSEGIPGTTAAASKPAYFSHTTSIRQKESVIHLVMHISNFNHRNGGPAQSIHIGREKDIRRKREQSVAIDIFLIGTFLIMSLYHLGIFFMRRQDKGYLYFALYCICLALFTSLNRECYFSHFFTRVPWNAAFKLVSISFYLSIPLFFHFLKHLFPRETNDTVVYVSYGVAVLFTLFSVFAGSYAVSRAIQGYQAITILSFFYMVYIFITAIIRREEGAKILITGFLILIGSATNDILSDNGIINTNTLLPFGLLVFLSSQALILSHRFNLNFKLVENQREELLATNRAFRIEINERHEAERALQHSGEKLEEINNILSREKERLQTTIQSIGEGVITTDTSGRIEIANESAAGIMDKPLDEIIGSSLNSLLPLYHDEFPGVPILPYEETLKSGKIISLDGSIRYISSTGRHKIISLISAPLLDEEGRIHGAVLVLRDTTEKTRIEQDIQRNSKIESLGIFAGGIAHDFNNLLTAIIGNISISRLNMHEGDPNYQNLREAESASIRARDLTQQLLFFSREGEPVKKITDLKNLLAETTRFVLSGSSIKCNFLIDENLKKSEIDEGQISQVIHNIVLNARQAMPDGGVITLKAENITPANEIPLLEATGNFIRVTITDEGGGIKNKDFNKIFDPYFTTKEDGHGLGLAISYSIIRRHGGSISFRSVPGRGTEFFIYLPATAKEELPVPAISEYASISLRRALVMDDEKAILDITEKMLNRLEVEVESALSGDEAVEIYRKRFTSGEPFDFCIMDLTVPGGMGGKEALEKILEIDPEVKAVVSSGYANDAVMVEPQNYGFITSIIKPYQLSDLQEIMNRLFGKE